MGDNNLSLEELGNSQHAPSHELIFYVNGKKIVEQNPNPEWTLLYYLRFKLNLSGTKEACGEGGCGACTVLQSKFDDESGKIINRAINACLSPLCLMHASAIITVEGIGSIRTGLHPVQERIAKSHGTQCGFCTPGFVMSMYALLRNNPEPTEEELEDAFQGNLCRCTGYRPILQGLKPFCKKPQPTGNEGRSPVSGCCGGRVSNGGGCCMDNVSGCTKTEVAHTLVDESQFKTYDPKQDIIFPPELQLDKKIRIQSLHFKGENVEWLKPITLEELLRLKEKYQNGKCVGGNTEIGIDVRFKHQVYPVLIQVSEIKDLTKIKIEDGVLLVGGSVTLSGLKDFCSKEKDTHFPGTVQYAIQEMLHWFAGQQIRNVATIAGSIVGASPIAGLNPILMACGAKLNLNSLKDGKRFVIMDDTFFLEYRKTVIKSHEILESVEIPLTKQNEFVWAIKQARRRDADFAIVNAGMRVVINPENLQIEDATLVFGGMGPTTKIAKKTSQFLISKKWTEETIEAASSELYEELKLDLDAHGGMIAYRQILAQSFLTKFFFTVSFWQVEKFPHAIKPKDPSAFTPISRGETHAVQLYQLVPNSQKVENLLGRPIPHLSHLKHATGEAIYTGDELPVKGQLYGTLVGSPIAHGKILSIDPSKALAIPGVVDFITANSIPTERNKAGLLVQDEEIFASEYVHAQGQVVGILVATDPLVAEKASKQIEMKFEEMDPILTIEQALEKENFHGVKKLKYGNIENAFENSDDFLEGEMRVGGQEHFYLETHSCLVVPKEDQELDILMSTQGPDMVQTNVAKALGIPANRVKVRCRRMGGAFGGKMSRCLMIALPTAVAAVHLGKSVRTVMSRCDDMVTTGGRHPFSFQYKVGFTREGKILGIMATMSSNAGWSFDTSTLVMEKALLSIDSAYTIQNWDVTGYVCKTNLPSNTAFRGYGGPQAMIFLENVLDMVAEKVGKSPMEIREMHLKRPNVDRTPVGMLVEEGTLQRCWEECVKNSKYAERKAAVDEFNGMNKWKKRGITAMPLKYDLGYHVSSMNQAGALVMIYTDGSVGLNHGGTEMGQGLLTKMAQVASRALGGVPLEKIYFSETSSDKIPNATPTCGSFASDLNGMAVKDACEQLVKRLEPFKQANPNGKWEDWVVAAYFNRVNLSAVGFYEIDLNYDFDKPEDLSRHPHLYTCYGAAVSEVEVDCLTGDHSVLATEIVFDVGESINPAVDVGQIEGAFMQGYGLFTMEELLYSPKGLLLTKGPGMYKIPSMGDIPRQFNISLLRGAPNPKAVYSSKGIGEPPLFLAASVYLAIKEAIKASRKERGLSTVFRLDCPATVERIRLAFEDETVEKVRATMDKPV